MNYLVVTQIALACLLWFLSDNTLRPTQYGQRFPDDIFKCVFFNETVWIAIKISLKFVPKVRINNIPELVQVMAWHQSVDEALSEPMLTQFTDAYMYMRH